MKHHRLLWFLSLLFCVSLSCNLPQSNVGNNQVLIEGVTVFPKSGSGNFSATVEFSKHNNPDTVQCYVTSTDSNDKAVVFTWNVKSNDGLQSKDFDFTVTQPGSHTLVCIALESSNAWSDDFMVVPAGDSIPTSTPIFTPDATPTATPLTTLVLTGTYRIAAIYMICNDGSHSIDPSTGLAGTMTLTLDYTTGQASASMQGTGGDKVVTSCGMEAATFRRTISASTINGTIDPTTGALAMTGDLTTDFWESCWSRDASGACVAGGSAGVGKITLTGMIDPSRPAGAGQVKWTEADDSGDWQAP